VHAAPASHILLTVARRGDHIDIAITDDMPGADADMRRAGVRSLMERVALRGGALDVDVRPAEGTTMTLRLAAVPNEKRDRVRPGSGRHDLPAAAGSAPNLVPGISSGTSH
jgi:signal transduction histidine kinase